MTSTIVSDPERVWDYLNKIGVTTHKVSGMQGLGLEIDGEIVAGVLFERFNGRNVWAHIGSDRIAGWRSEENIAYSFHYAFNVLGVERISGYVEDSNIASKRLCEKLGFKQEAVLSGAARDGGDVILYVIWREGCRYVDQKQA